MTETEARQLKNEVAFLKRKLAAIERKYGPLKGRSFLALLCSREHGRNLVGDTILVTDSADGVTATNFLRSIERELVAKATDKKEQP